MQLSELKPAPEVPASPARTRHHSRRPILAYALLALACAAVFLSAAATRPARHGIYMDQISYLLQSLSVAHDFDFRYTEADRERFQALGWGSEPKGLFLRERKGEFYFAKPVVYALLAAPFTLLSPNTGALLLNAILWAVLVAITFAWFRRWMADLEAALLALLCWGATSALFYVYVIHADLLIAALLAGLLSAGFAPLAFREENSDGAPAVTNRRAVAVGLLSALMVYEKLPLVFFAVALLLCWLRRGLRRQALTALSAAAALFAVFCVWHYAEDRSFTPYQGHRIVVTEVDPLSDNSRGLSTPAATGSRKFFEKSGAAKILSPERLAGLATYTPRFALHFFVGRKVGLFPYMTSFLLVGLLAAWGLRRRPARQALWVLAPLAVYTVFYFVILPLNYHGGPTTLGNRYALQALPALIFALGYRPIGPWPVRAVLLAAALSAVYFPGRLFATPATAIRDNFPVFQWNRFRPLPVEPELLWTGCDQHTSRVSLSSDVQVLRLSEANETGAGSRFWLAAGAYNRFAALSRTETTSPVELLLSSSGFSGEGEIRSGSRITRFSFRPGSVQQLSGLLEKTAHVPGVSAKGLDLWPFDIRVTSATRQLATPGLPDDCALHISLLPGSAGTGVTPPAAAAAPTSFAVRPGDAACEPWLLWGWYEAGGGQRWAGGTLSSALWIPSGTLPSGPLRVRLQGNSVGGPLRASVRVGEQTQTYALDPATTTVELLLNPQERTNTPLLVQLLHEEARVPAALTGDPEGDRRALTALYPEILFEPVGNSAPGSPE